ncbi:hypothetical protein LXM94_15570 [Rhizobium sp. TRM95111]|uniref:hypothetical protein n=1 Tax=Rhizobium alarense TaxID=2846851 RepID=UPI001F375EAB|nr:hypothetical protein [Rhizobium alarense]MCF3641392.1 hypothetical protein [Rhizobium alarense]
MLNGTTVHLDIYAPTLKNKISTTATEQISSGRTEFDDLQDYDISGDSYTIVSAKLDISGLKVRYTITDNRFSGFANVQDFNGYVLTFDGFGGARTLHSVTLQTNKTTLAIDESAFSVTNNKLFVNVDAVAFKYGDSFTLLLGVQTRGTKSNDRLVGGNGADELLGRDGNDRLRGEGGDDDLLGGGGRDRISGGGGNDYLNGGGGGDKLAGGGGSDHFVFAGRFGRDKIVDFDATGAGHDILDLTSVNGIDNFADLKDNHMVQRTDGVRIKFSDVGTIVLKNVQLDELQHSDFLL